MGNYLLILMLMVVIFLFCLFYIKNKKDFADPCTTTMLIFAASITFCIFGNLYWNAEFEIVPFLILTLGILSVPLGSEFGSYLAHNKCKIHKNHIENNMMGIDRIDISKFKVLIVIGLTVILTCLYAADIISLSAKNSSGLNFTTKLASSGNFYFRQGMKFVMASAYVNTFILVNNLLSKKRKSIDFIYSIPIICGFIYSFVTGVRTEIFRLIICAFIYWVVLYKQKKHWTIKATSLRVLIKKIAVPISVFLLAFFGMRTIIKFSGQTENKVYGPLMYFAYYIGSPWLVIAKKISMGLNAFKGDFWGEITFSSLYTDLNDFGMIHATQIKGEQFVTVDTKNAIVGNADTIFGQPLVDFGVIGMIIVIVLMFMLLTYLYESDIRYTVSNYRRNLKLIEYSFFFFIVGLSFYSNLLGIMVSVYFLITYITIILIYKFYFGFHINKQ